MAAHSGMHRHPTKAFHCSDNSSNPPFLLLAALRAASADVVFKLLVDNGHSLLQAAYLLAITFPLGFLFLFVLASLVSNVSHALKAPTQNS